MRFLDRPSVVNNPRPSSHNQLDDTVNLFGIHAQLRFFRLGPNEPTHIGIGQHAVAIDFHVFGSE